ncbi:MAG: S-methyl-5'-thioadenosine phosphorylase [Rhodobacteraceae bacterium]|uniref:S-methyl-5'-thioadenosine phosphorylase n=1 Tax=Thioclava sp. L04-15 TaxID=1915318 RepID=UPI0009977DD9|nr:S-methyl-5'-thioadenosine phosphorylase [Thioclava sp. L04-15]OOY29306.1 methylthioadenosine phosphorylase [Thioclava sp. L04-15]TNE92954.1 MAG: S-methyl-5'-thioadenosine phosphorylase [Paracoccaceae bacterium]TNF15755.1 MAG: S-methyl-5'-thioadenosine phosphorylase [Paracoccaceae bacterium]
MEKMIGVIGGSGVYQIDGLEGAEWVTVDTPFGAPSDQVLTGTLHGVKMAFLPRHGRGHVETPTTVPYRANIAAMKQLGVTDLVAVSAVGSLKEAYAPGDFLIVDQYIDRTFAREKSFFGPGMVGHVSVAHPVCADLSAACAEAARKTGVKVHEGGTYVAMEGPQFSTKAESELYRQWGADVIGMTGMPEAKLAREAELHYACVAMITDFDCWHPDHDAVDVAQVVAVAMKNASKARDLVAALPALLKGAAGECTTGCTRALDSAIMTAPDKRSAEMKEKLKTIAGRVLDL